MKYRRHGEKQHRGAGARYLPFLSMNMLSLYLISDVLQVMAGRRCVERRTGRLPV